MNKKTYKKKLREIETRKRKTVKASLKKRSKLSLRQRLQALSHGGSLGSTLIQATNRGVMGSSNRAKASKSIGHRAVKGRASAAAAVRRGLAGGQYRLTTARKAALAKAQKMSARLRRGRKS